MQNAKAAALTVGDSICAVQLVLIDAGSNRREQGGQLPLQRFHCPWRCEGGDPACVYLVLLIRHGNFVRGFGFVIFFILITVVFIACLFSVFSQAETR